MSCEGNISAPITLDKIEVSAPVSYKKIFVDAPVGMARGAKGDKGDTADAFIYYPAGVSVLSYQPVAVIDGLVYPLDASDMTHLFAFSGFAITSASAGSAVTIQTTGEVALSGWGLVSGSHYLAGGAAASGAGTMIPAAIGSTVEMWVNVIGYAVSTDKLRIIKDDSPTIRA